MKDPATGEGTTYDWDLYHQTPESKPRNREARWPDTPDAPPPDRTVPLVIEPLPTPTPAPTQAPAATDWRRILERLPASFKQRGIWYADRARALELAGLFGDPLSAVLLPREVVLAPEGAEPVQYDKPAGWGTLHEWEVFGAGYYVNNTGGSWWGFGLFYPDWSAATDDAPELERRLQSYTTFRELPADAQTSLGIAWPAQPFAEFCDHIH